MVNIQLMRNLRDTSGSFVLRIPCISLVMIYTKYTYLKYIYVNINSM